MGRHGLCAIKVAIFFFNSFGCYVVALSGGFFVCWCWGGAMDFLKPIVGENVKVSEYVLNDTNLQMENFGEGWCVG